MAKKLVTKIPKNYPVQPLRSNQKCAGRTTCGHCGLSWDDDKSTSMTPVPSARCPFETFHIYEDEGSPKSDIAGMAAAVEYGYRACEKGKNLQMALAEFRELTREPNEEPDREGGNVMGSYEERRDSLVRHLDERIRTLRK